MKDYYQILGIKENASAEEIRERWIKLMQKCHPDQGIHGEMDEQRTMEINEAYQVLKHSSTRMEYDLERHRQRSLKKFSIYKFIVPVSGLTFILILSLIYIKRPHTPTRMNLKTQLPPLQTESSSVPHDEPGSLIHASPHVSKTEKVEKVEQREKVVLKQKGREMRTAPLVQKRKIEPPLPKARSTVSVNPPSFSTSQELNRPESIEDLRAVKPTELQEKISTVHPISDPTSLGKVEDRGTETKPPLLMATEGEVKQFFDNYIKRYTQKDIDGFLSFFSPKAIQNQKDGLERIRRIYDNFFSQSQEISYRMDDMKIEIYQNTVEVNAKYELDQILKEGGDRKVWKGHIQWILNREEGILKIMSINYKHQSPP